MFDKREVQRCEDQVLVVAAMVGGDRLPAYGKRSSTGSDIGTSPCFLIDSTNGLRELRFAKAWSFSWQSLRDATNRRRRLCPE